jgi:hypothetical protein
MSGDMPRRGSHKVKYFSNKSLNENMIDKCGGFLKWGIHLNHLLSFPASPWRQNSKNIPGLDSLNWMV